MQTTDLIESCFGRGLSVREKLVVDGSLRRLQVNENFRTATFWGKILGQETDYLIAQAVNISDSIDKHYYFSTDRGLSFSKLPNLDDFINSEAPKIFGLFTGNPSRKCYVLSREALRVKAAAAEGKKIQEEKREKALEPEDDEMGGMTVQPEAPAQRVLMEVERLAWSVKSIDADTCLIPKGSFYKSATGQIKKNLNFTGIPLNANPGLKHFQLLRNPTQPKILAAVRKFANTNSLEFLDEPSNPDHWVVSVGDDGLTVTLRTMVWPGFQFTASLGPNLRQQSLYFGYGERNCDLSFMM